MIKILCEENKRKLNHVYFIIVTNYININNKTLQSSNTL